MTIYTLRLEVCSPVHIRANNSYLDQAIDFIRINKWIYRLDIDHVIDTMMPDFQKNPDLYQQMLNMKNIGSVVTKKHLDNDNKLWLYRTQTPIKANQIQPFITNIQNLPYIPGSTLKGALRTAYIRSLFYEQKYKLVVNKMPPRQKSQEAFAEAEQNLISGGFTGEIARKNDLFRAIQVSDSSPAKRENATVVNVRRWPNGPHISIEAIDEKEILHQRIKFDSFLLSLDKKSFSWANQGSQFVPSFWELCRQQGRQRIEQERRFWAARSGATQVEDFYNQLADDAASNDHFYIEVGWGTGWKSKTVGGLIRDEQTIAQLIARYNLGNGSYSSNHGFPKTRSAIVDIYEDAPLLPMGWVKVTVEGM